MAKGRPREYTARDMIQALTETKGMVYLAAKRLGCNHTTVYRYIQRYPTVKAAWEEQGGEVLDTAELRLYWAIQRGEPWAIQFYLRTKGKGRGYVERSEVSGPDEGPIQVDQRTEIDFSKFTTEQLESLAAILESASDQD